MRQSLSRSIFMGTTICAFCARMEFRFSVTAIRVTPFLLHTSMMGSSSAVLPPRDTITTASPFFMQPMPPCTASAGERNCAPRSMQQSECANFLAAMPLEPLAQVVMRGAAASALTAS